MGLLNKIEKEREDTIYESYVCHAFLEKICEIMDTKKIKRVELAKKLGVSKSEVSKLLSSDRNITLKSLAKIFFALGEKIEILTTSELDKMKCSFQKERIIVPQPNVLLNYHPQESMIISHGSRAFSQVRIGEGSRPATYNQNKNIKLRKSTMKGIYERGIKDVC